MNKSLNVTEDENNPPLNPPSNQGGEKDEDCNDTCSEIPENFEKNLEEKILENQSEKQEKIHDKFVIKIPKNAIKQDLHDLKAYLLSLETGFINIYINLK
jgi:hypothetical protein